MRRVFLTPGPTQLNEVAQAAYIEAISTEIASMTHRGEKFQQINIASKQSLRELFSIPESHSIFWLASGTESWERIIQNGVIKASHHFVNGAFSERFYKVSSELQRQATKTSADWFKSFNFDVAQVPNQAELIGLTHNETSSGVMLSRDEIVGLSARYPDKLIALDAVSSAPYADVPWGVVDYCFFSVQKFFGLPAGLGALVVSPRALEKSKEVLAARGSIGSYHSFTSLKEFDEKNETPATPNVIGIYALGKVCQAMLEEGIGEIRKKTEEEADALYTFFDQQISVYPAVRDRAARSKTVVCINAGEQTEEIKKLLAAQGIFVGSGYGKYAKTHLRIANFWKGNASRVVDALK